MINYDSKTERFSYPRSAQHLGICGCISLKKVNWVKSQTANLRIEKKSRGSYAFKLFYTYSFLTDEIIRKNVNTKREVSYEKTGRK